ncbi:ABC transporter substrate-binding protein [Leucobacter ruminantium]|uniref:ABC transporter substrate-binding protein n=1 Tax=Leucobacter ruminantium TaxID=1289170 RepID=A0A939LWR2_9MICO|nr:ABC transporter substrate-binding protein [Leucobacter ruminantium]MBO1804573.1 ABC transporter substrate-binding protein [Leucobacter ruminantium]
MNTLKSRKMSGALALVLGAGLALAGCSNAADISEPVEDAPSDGELFELTVATLPIGDLGAYFYAEDNGIFEKHGLDITTETATGGSAAIAAMVAGDYDIVYSGADGAIKAFESGLPVRVISGANLNQPEGEKDSTGLIAAPGIASVEDIAGTAIGTNALGNINQVYTQEYLSENGVTDFEVVEIPFPEQVAALNSGQISASLLPEPFASQAIAEGATVLGYPYRTGADQSNLVGVYVSTEQTIESEAEAVEAFVAAMTEASEAANDKANRDALIESILSHTKLSGEVANAMVFVHFTTEAEAPQLQATADLLTKFGVFPGEVDVAGLIAE